MTLSVLIIKYTFFAIIATIANLSTQRIILWYDKSIIFFSLAVGLGTLVGLLIKYFLDKRWIFYDLNHSMKGQRKKFTLYAIMGVFTTIIFWSTETIFWIYWQTDFMREFGAVIGLGVGYIIKYNLDRLYVFKDLYLRQPK